MAELLLANNAYSNLAAGIASGDLSLTVTTGQGARFPAIAGGDWFYVTLQDASNNIEIVKVTARTGDSMTIERAQESTTARAWNLGDVVDLRLTAGIAAPLRALSKSGSTLTSLLNFAISGTLSVSGVAGFASGTLALPSMVRAANPTTGLYFPDSTTVAFSSLASHIFRAGKSSSGDPTFAVGSTTLTGLGTNYGTLKVNGSAGSGFRLFTNEVDTALIYVDGDDLYIQNQTATGNLYLGSNATAKVALTQVGDLVLGSTASDAVFSSFGSEVPRHEYYSDGVNCFTIGYRGASAGALPNQAEIRVIANQPLVVSTNNAEATRVTSARYFKASNTGAYTLHDGTNLSTALFHHFQNDANEVVVFSRSTNTGGSVVSYFSELQTGATGQHFRGRIGGVDQIVIAANGSITNTTGVYGTISDANLKNVLSPAPSYWEKYKLIEWVKYVLKNDPTNQEMLGVIAQQVQGIFPGLIESNPDMERVTKTRDVSVTRQVTVTKLEPTTRTEIVFENGKWVQKVIEETVEVAEPQFDEFDLFDERGNVVLRLVSPEVQAVEGRPAIISDQGMVIEPAVEAIEYQPAVYEPAKHKVPRMETVTVPEQYEEMVPTGTYTLSVKYSILGHIGDVVLQEAMARIEALEAA